MTPEEDELVYLGGCDQEYIRRGDIEKHIIHIIKCLSYHVRDEERKRCAKIAEEVGEDVAGSLCGERETAEKIAQKIRSGK